MANQRTRFDILIGAQDNTKGALRTAGRDVDGLGKKVAGLMGKYVGLAAAGAGVLTFLRSSNREFVQQGSRLVDLQRRLGGTVQSWNEMLYVGRQFNVNEATMSMGLQRMTRRLGEVARFGKGEAAPALEALNLRIEEFQGLNPADSFQLLASRLSEVDDAGERAALAMKFFDSEGVALVQTMEGGADAIKALREEVGGYIDFTDEMADRAARAAREQDKLNTALRAMKVIIGDEIFKKTGGFREWLAGVIGDFNTLIPLLANPNFQGIADYVAKGLPNKEPFFGGLETGIGFIPAGGPGSRSRDSDAARSERMEAFRVFMQGQAAAAGFVDPMYQRFQRMESSFLAKPGVSPLAGGGLGRDVNFLQPLLEKLPEATEDTEDWIDALDRQKKATDRLGESFSVNIIDSAYRAADSWAFFTASAILNGRSVFDALTNAWNSLAQSILSSLLQFGARSILGAVLPTGFAEIFQIGSSSSRQAASDYSNTAPPARLAPRNAGAQLNIQVNAGFGTRGEGQQAARVIAGYLQEIGYAPS